MTPPTLFAHKRPKFSTIERFISQSFCGLTNNGENQGGGLMLIPAHNRPLPKAYGSQTSLKATSSSSEDTFKPRGWLTCGLQRSERLSAGWWSPRFVKWDLRKKWWNPPFLSFPFFASPTSATSNAPNSTNHRQHSILLELGREPKTSSARQRC